MKKVLVRSMLGLLGDLENKVMFLIEEDFDEQTGTWFAVVTDDVLRGKKHKIALEHIAEYVGDVYYHKLIHIIQILSFS